MIFVIFSLIIFVVECQLPTSGTEGVFFFKVNKVQKENLDNAKIMPSPRTKAMTKQYVTAYDFQFRLFSLAYMKWRIFFVLFFYTHVTHESSYFFLNHLSEKNNFIKYKEKISSVSD